ncbi:LLM class flavin-dependent oxidoreductase [Ktedonosporobacter rubrisoli]|nr:LLM class flavin-dependent oxidoreductase [Ktedonosporobacter rubrisoli]
MTSVQFGWVLPGRPNERGNIAQPKFLAHLQQGLRLAVKSFHSVWSHDHLQFMNDQILESWTMLTYLAPLYPQLQFGSLVLSQSYRNPALLAKMAATFQYLSNGRLILGLGAGWHEEEYKAYGYAFPPPHKRVAQLEEALQIIRALWQNSGVTIQGKHYQILEAHCEPRPVPVPPIVVGGARPQMLNIVARHADWWSADRPGLATYRQQVVDCERACLAIQRDPLSLRRTWFGGCICRATEDALRPLRATYPDEYGLVGTVSQVKERIQEFIDLGVSYFMLNTGDFPDLTTLELLVDEVLPSFQHTEYQASTL